MEPRAKMDAILTRLVDRRLQGRELTSDLPLGEILEIPEALGFILGCSTRRHEDGTPAVLEKLIEWSVTILAVREDFQRQFNRDGMPAVEKMHLTHSSTMATNYKLLCGALYAGYLDVTPPFWIEPLVQHEDWPRLIEWALPSAGNPRSRVLEEVWQIDRHTELEPWFRQMCHEARNRLGEQRFLPIDGQEV